MRLPVRQYRCYPPPGAEYDESAFGHVSRVLDLEPAAVALITVDLWNMGWGDEPLVPELGRQAEHNFVGLGRRAGAEARRITEEHIAPVLAAAREAGLTIIHSNSPQVVARHPECAYTVPEPPPASTACDPWPQWEAGCSPRDEYVAATYGPGAEAVWERMRAVADFPPPVRPVRGDLCVYQQAAVDAILQRRRVTTVIHVGFLLAHCLLDKPGGVRSLAAVWRSPGYRDIVLRDCTVAQESRETIDDFATTKAFIFWLEATGIPTSTAAEFIAAARG